MPVEEITPAAAPAGSAPATYAEMLLQHHDECTFGDTYPEGGYPGEDADRLEFDRLANSMFQALGRSTRVMNVNRAEALYTARQLIAQANPREGIWEIEVLDTDPHSPRCGDWRTDTAVTGERIDGEPLHSIHTRAMGLTLEGHTTRVVLVAKRAYWTSAMPWQRHAR